MSILKQQLNDFSQTVRGQYELSEKGFDGQGAAIYKELFINNFNSLISSCFPILRSILPRELWHSLVKEIFTKVKLQKTIFYQISFELVSYLEHNPLVDYPFAFDLAHYEWLELEIELRANEINFNSFEPNLDVLNYSWRLSSCAVIKLYKYDVHNIGPNYQPKKEINTCLIVYKNNDQVQFIKVSDQSYQLLQCVFSETISAKEIIINLCLLYPNLNQSQLLDETKKLISMLYQEQVILLE